MYSETFKENIVGNRHVSEAFTTRVTRVVAGGIKTFCFDLIIMVLHNLHFNFQLYKACTIENDE